MESNLKIEEYLSFYCKNSSHKGYALMLDGAWGSGKTHLINKFRKDPDFGKKIIYVSLYGLSQPREIDDKIFEQLHPILSSKTVAVASKVIKSAVKLGFKLDLNSDGKDDAEISTPSINLKDLINTSKEAVIIFDDLERCLIPVDQVLGYINFFVEHYDQRVIILANELEILKHLEEGKKKYYELKEKLIGRTFSIAADVNLAFDSFVETLAEQDIAAIWSARKSFVIEIFNQSEYQNLRSLKQSIIEFNRLYRSIPDYAKENGELISRVLKSLLILTFEIKKGSIQIEEIKVLSRLTYIPSTGKELKPHPVKAIENKYGSYFFSQLCPSDENWYDYFKVGSMDAQKLETSLQNSEFFNDEFRDEWIQLWYFRKQETPDFEELKRVVWTKFLNHEYRKIGILKHIAGMFLYFSTNHLHATPKKEIERLLKLEIKHLFDENLIEHEKIFDIFENRSYASLGFFENESKEFLNLLKYINTVQTEADARRHPDQAEELLNLITSNPKLFWHNIGTQFEESHKFRKVPILSYISTQTFIDSFLACPNAEKDNIVYAIKDRFEFIDSRPELQKDHVWLLKLGKEVTAKIKRTSGLDKYYLKFLNDYSIAQAIKQMNSPKVVAKTVKSKLAKHSTPK